MPNSEKNHLYDNIQGSQQQQQQYVYFPTHNPSLPFCPVYFQQKPGDNSVVGGENSGDSSALHGFAQTSMSDLTNMQNPPLQMPEQFPSSCIPNYSEATQPQRRKRPWYMWTIGVVDIIAALLLTTKVVQNVVTKDRFVADRDTLMWVFFFIFLSLCVQFFMGVGLLVGLKSVEDGTTFWYCQCWICGAYFLFCETGILLFGTILKLQSSGDDIGIKLVIVVTKVAFRILSFFLVRRFMNDLRGKSQYRMSAADIEQYQQHRMRQIQQLQQYKEQQQQHMFRQAHSRQNSVSRVDGRERMSSAAIENYNYAPQMGLMMAMVMNQVATATVDE